MSGLIVDASVGIKLFLDEEKSERVRDIFAAFSNGEIDALFVPDLFFIECANILWKKVKRRELPFDLAAGYLTDLASFELPSVSTELLMQRALGIAYEHGITAYDACYVALAEMKGVPLVTADEKLGNALANSEHEVQML